jgi:fibronectin type 3 domain-containing protein
MKTILLFISFLSAASSLLAQNLEVFTANNTAGKIQVKWMGKDLQPDTYFELHRKEQNGSWQLLTTLRPKEIIPVKTLEGMNDQAPYSREHIQYSFYRHEMLADKEMAAFLWSQLLLQSLSNNELAAALGNYYLDASAVNGINYQYKVIPILAGKRGSEFVSASISVQPFQPVDAPLSPSKGSSVKEGIALHWTTHAAYASYTILRNGVELTQVVLSEEQLQQSKKGQPFFVDTDTTLADGKSYTYTIQGLDFFGQSGKSTTSIGVLKEDKVSPFTVTALTVDHNEQFKAVVRWKKSSSKDVFQQYVVRIGSKGDSLNLTPSGLAAGIETYTDATVQQGMDYRYRIVIKDKNGNSTTSLSVRHTIPDATPPAVPVGLKATAASGSIQLQWTANKDADLQGYHVFRSIVNSQDEFHLLNTDPVTGTGFLDTLPKENGNVFYYRICAVDKSYNRSAYSKIIQARMPDIVAPSPVRLSSAEYLSGKVQLQWKPSQEADFYEYQVYASSADSLEVMSAPKLITKTRNTQYEHIPTGRTLVAYTIVVRDSTGNTSEPSNPKQVYTGVTELQEFTATAQYQTRTGTVLITWPAQAHCAYKVYLRDPSGDLLPLSNKGSTTIFEATQVDKGAELTYVVRKFNAAGEFIDSAPVVLRIPQ